MKTTVIAACSIAGCLLVQPLAVAQSSAKAIQEVGGKAVTIDPIVINETIVLDKATLWKAKKVVFGEKAVVVTNAFFLSIEAEQIDFAGAPRMVSFQTRSPQHDGLNAGTIFIQAKSLQGDGVLSVNNLGENGLDGAQGPKGTKGPKGPQGTQRDWNPWNGCIGGSNGGQGGKGGPGGTGQRAGHGGQGGDVILLVNGGLLSGATKRIEISMPGGKAGQPGPGGPGGDPGDGGDGAPGTAFCGGTGPGPNGPGGDGGPRGADGKDGADGKVTVLGGLTSVNMKTFFGQPKK